MENINEAIEQTKLNLIFNGSVFFSTIAFSLNLVITTEVETAATNGKDLLINPTFFINLNKEERLFLFLHEICHVVFMHMSRIGTKNLNKFNRAADYAINIHLTDLGYTLIKGGLCDAKYRNMSAEDIYKLLPEQDNAPFDCDLVVSPTSDDITSIESLLIKAVNASEAASEEAGTVPNWLQRKIEEIYNPTVSWKELLQNYINSYNKEDFSLRMPNRRYLHYDMYLPTLYSETLDNVTIAIDCSASVTPEEFLSFISEIHGIREAISIENLTVFQFDTKLKTVYEFTQDMDLDTLELVQGGGTNLTPVFNYTNKNEPNLLIVFSDLRCSPIKEKPTYDVLWICVNNIHAKTNFGTKINYTTGT